MNLTLRNFLEDLFENPFTLASVILSVVPLAVGVVFLALNPKLFRLIVKNLGRNVLRTALTAAAITALVVMVTMIWTVVFFLDAMTKERSKDFKLIVTERWQLPSQMPMTHADYLNPRSPKFILDRKDVGIDDFMTWSFYGGTLDPVKRTRENLVFFFVMNPDFIRTMMDDLENFDPALIRKLKENRRGCLVGKERLQSLDKRVGERFKVYSINYKDIDLEFEVIGVLPEGRYNQSAIMNAEYFDLGLDDYNRRTGKKHPLDNRRLNLVWLRVPDREAFERVAAQIENSKMLTNPQVRCETAATGVASFLDAYRDLLWGMKWILVPAMLGCMALVVANAISISVRERYKEIAVLKVLGYRPWQVQVLVLGESLLVGGISGLMASGITFGFINLVLGGVKFPIAFFPAFFVPIHALWWGLAVGFMTALLGSFLPAWSARTVRVSEVFSRVA